VNLQYISDSKGQTTGVFIPIHDWNELVKKYKGIEQEEIDIPGWHKEIIKARLNDYQKNPEEVEAFDTAMDKIDDQL
jgi:hypothetical protein